MTTTTVQIRRKGVITLPVALRRQYGLDEGDVFTLVDLGDGSFLLTLNRRHFIHDPGAATRSGLRIGAPRDALAWVRRTRGK